MNSSGFQNFISETNTGINFTYKQFVNINEKIRIWAQVAGLVGNLLMILVYYQPRLRKLSVSVYLRWMAVFCACQNSCFLAFYLIEIPEINMTVPICKLVTYFYFLFTPMCAWMDSIAGLDRFLSIVFSRNKTFKFIKRALFQRLVIFSVIIFNLTIYSTILINGEFFHSRSVHKHETIAFFRCVVWLTNGPRLANLINGTFVPFFIMFTTSIATLVGVLAAHRRIRASSRFNRTHRTLQRDIKFGLTIIFLNLLFFTMNFTSRFSAFIKLNPFRIGTSSHSMFVMVFSDLYEFYYALIFYVQLAVNSLVRRELFDLFKRVFGYQ